MKTVSFTMVKNEEDIIESFVRYNLKSIDHMYIADNLSTDGTRDILRALKNEGLPLTITIDRDQAHKQNAKMTKMYRSAFGEEFSFAFLLDADELLDVDREQMHAAWESAGGGNAYYVPRTNYLYGGEVDAGDEISIFKRMSIADTVPEAAKSMIFHDAAKCRRFRIGNGNHHIRDWSKDGLIISKAQEVPFARIRHFPIRSVEQYVGKSLLGWLSLQMNHPEANVSKRAIGSHWRTQYRLILEQNCQIGADQLTDNLYGGRYAERCGESDALNVDFDLRYTHLMRRPSVLTQVVKMYEKTIANIWAENGATRNSKAATQKVAVAPAASSGTQSSALNGPEIPGNAIPMYWWDNEKNFGDLIGPWMAGILSGRPVYNTKGNRGRGRALVTVGSLISSLDRPGLEIWGTGSIRPFGPKTISALTGKTPTKIHAVRGKRTHRELTKKLGWDAPEVFGDPALLLPRLYVPKEISDVQGTTALVPHFSHLPFFERLPTEGFSLVGVRADPDAVIDQIASADRCIATSLHGVIVAQAYGIPWVWLQLEDAALLGDAFKFEDFFSVLDRSAVAHFKCRGTDVSTQLLTALGKTARVPKMSISLDPLFDAFPRNF